MSKWSDFTKILKNLMLYMPRKRAEPENIDYLSIRLKEKYIEKFANRIRI